MQVLANIPEQAKGENLYIVERIKIGRLTGLFDKDEDGTIDTLIVYIQPIDTQGDIIKASGSIDVQLWDLNNSDGQAKLDQWQVGPEQLKDLWIAFVATNYRLPFDIKEIIEDFERSLTVKVTFTDHLSGKIFEEQKVIEIPSDY